MTFRVFLYLFSHILAKCSKVSEETEFRSNSLFITPPDASRYKRTEATGETLNGRKYLSSFPFFQSHRIFVHSTFSPWSESESYTAGNIRPASLKTIILIMCVCHKRSISWELCRRKERNHLMEKVYFYSDLAYCVSPYLADSVTSRCYPACVIQVISTSNIR